MADAGSDNPDKAKSRASRSGKNRHGVDRQDAGQVQNELPEFCVEALSHLHVQSHLFLVHAECYADSPTDQNREVLIEDLQRIRNTLVLLEKPAAIYVTAELLRLLQADEQGVLSNQSELARVLTSAGEHLRSHAELLQQDFGRDSALPLLTVVNDSRACREEALLSDTIVLAAGIEIPDSKLADDHSSRWLAQRDKWIRFSSTRHSRIARGLLNWWQSSEPDALHPLIRELTRFAKASGKYDYLQSVSLLFEAATTVGAGIADSSLADGPALRSLFAQLERSIRRTALAKVPDDLVAKDLLRNFLYYVAQTDVETSTARKLRRLFRLDRISAAAHANQLTDTPTIGVGYHLANSIRSGIARETQPLQEWFDDGDGNERPAIKNIDIIRLKVRLAQLEPVLALMGAPDALGSLREINRVLKTVSSLKAVPQSSRENLAILFSELDNSLEQSARSSIRTSPVNSLPAALDREDVFLDMATDACLREARNRLQNVSQILNGFFVSTEQESKEISKAVLELKLVSLSLQVLPLPEVSALLFDISALLERLGSKADDRSASAYKVFRINSVREEINTLLVSLDGYLSCVMQVGPEASQWLLDAEESMELARERLGSSIAEQTFADLAAPDNRAAKRGLEIRKRLGQAIKLYRDEHSSAAMSSISDSLKDLSAMEVDGSFDQLTTLGLAADAWLQRCSESQTVSLSEQSLATLDEVHAIIPKLLHKTPEDIEQRSLFENLIQHLTEADATTGVNDDLFEWSEDIGNLTLNVDDDLLQLSSVDSVHETVNMDSSNESALQEVFFHECLNHLEQLEVAVKTALQPSPDLSQRLPNEPMLRSLHTLTASAQSVDAVDIVNIVLPLQRAALARQRLESPFDASETRFVGDVVMALRARLEALKTGAQVGKSVRVVEQKLNDFLASSVPGSDSTDSGLAISENLHGLDDVFAEEANDILNRIRTAAHTVPFAPHSLKIALASLHTLKGSARMAGKSAIAQQAHDLEARIQESADDLQKQQALLKDGLHGLHGDVVGDKMQSALQNEIRSDEHGKRSISKPSNEGLTEPAAGLRVSSAGFESLLDLTTDVIVSQARLSEELASLREVYQDIDSASSRWHNLADTSNADTTPAFRETLADLEAARSLMRNALRQAEREQQHASKASAVLQQNLIRTRLMRIDELDSRLSSVVQDAAEKTGCSVKLVFEGGEVTLDRNLFKQLIHPLEHLVRNAVVHGIEPAEVRLEKGKSAEGRLTLAASIDGTDLCIQFRDDGRGIDRRAINSLLQERGKPAAQTSEAIQDLLFSTGFSTLDNADILAGHGLGLAAVRASIDQLGGVIQMHSKVGTGTSFSLRLPQRIVVNQVVLVQSQGQLFAIPVNQVEAVRQIGMRHSNKQQSEDPSYRQHALAELLRQQEEYSLPKDHSGPVVILSGSQPSMAIEVDQIIGYREIVTQALGPQMSTLGRFIGGSVMSDGKQVLIVDAASLLQESNPLPEKSAHKIRKSLRPVALIIDDSLTMRAAAELVLRQNGIATRVSRDGLEALDSMDVALPNLVLLDIEMPRLDGLDMMRRMNERFGKDSPPVIVISSKDDQAIRKTFLDMGAVRFLAKPYSESQLQEAVEAAGVRLPDLTIA